MSKTPRPAQQGSRPSCSLYVIPASDGKSAVVFRRGPTKRVMIARWSLKDDRVDHGHWFAGRVYERHCDVSPDGTLLLYFAARYKAPLPTWTAVSRVPYLTALVMWTCYVNGGGYFETNRAIALDEFVSSEALRSKNRQHLPFPVEELTRHLSVRHIGSTDDLRRPYCVEHGRLVRDGWHCTSEGVQMVEGRFRFEPRLVEPQVYERSMPNRRTGTRSPTLRRLLKSVGEYKTHETFEVIDHSGMRLRELVNCTWADWHMSGDLLFARDGCLFRLKRIAVSTPVEDPLANATLVHDFRALDFEKRKPPEWATQWPD